MSSRFIIIIIFLVKDLFAKEKINIENIKKIWKLRSITLKVDVASAAISKFGSSM